MSNTLASVELPHYQVFKELFLREQSLKTEQNIFY